jgi:hypothetical protein
MPLCKKLLLTVWLQAEQFQLAFEVADLFGKDSDVLGVHEAEILHFCTKVNLKLNSTI